VQGFQKRQLPIEAGRPTVSSNYTILVSKNQRTRRKREALLATVRTANVAANHICYDVVECGCKTKEWRHCTFSREFCCWSQWRWREMKVIGSQWNWWHDLLMEQLDVPRILRRWVPECLTEWRMLQKLYVVVWRALLTQDANISTTYQRSPILVNSTTIDRLTFTSLRTVSITIHQVCKLICK